MKIQLKLSFFEFWPQQLYFYPKIQSAGPFLTAGLSVCLRTKVFTLKSLIWYTKSIDLLWTLSGRESIDLVYQIYWVAMKNCWLWTDITTLNIGNQTKNFISGITSSSSLIDCAGQIARISKLSRNFSCRESAQFATLACAPAYLWYLSELVL